uniref:U-box domain-containing protein n=1 Tax=Candidatus Kentrum sp. SD TaxID=2126332 RepID=A0A451BRY4_9GAMM|nr:MAG: U-box domain-containing protein [Candidatus Kentron sp. SD]VFK81064.1 MAG: U-box domain-containing protein [Candidatus Kentron sp. SD]
MINASTQTEPFNEVIKKYLNLSEDLLELPEEAKDPVTFEVMTEPMLAYCGHTLDRSTITKIARVSGNIANKSIECPLCKREVKVAGYYSDIVLKSLIDKMVQKSTAVHSLEKQNKVNKANCFIF